jgi:hypothetical protein
VIRSLLPAAAAFALVVGALAGCQNYQDQLHRAEQHYGNARYEAALVNLEDLEIHVASLSKSERVRYDLVRGMTHLRLNQPQDARHWLAIAREDARNAPDALTEANRTTIERTLVELDPLNPHSDSSAQPSGDSNAGGGSSSTPAAQP